MLYALCCGLDLYLSVLKLSALDGNLLALSLIYCISMSEPFEFYVRASADLETYVSERIVEMLFPHSLHG